ncbi:MAG TPA: vanadium-dependent haloperoxidase, partial [Sphingobacteriaceae bacterium]
WCKIRPMVLDSAAQIVAPPPVPFDMKDPNSPFYRNALEVKLLGDSLTDEQKHIADFWDDNAFKLNVSGHVMFGTKKFSPGGHWMNIVGIATKDQKEDFNSTVSLYTEASIALFDGFINCWFVKFQRNYVRPETVINKYLDPDWKPYIQTPPFPEYTSGHAVISAAVAEVLTIKLGDKIAFRDSSQLEFGIKPRSFNSFRDAAREASMSRVYGGIHYVASCDIGAENGEQIGRLVADRLRLKKQTVLSAR